ncbi:MAG: flagellar biosynthetic protein FliR [Rhodospirillales bacterium]
MLADFLAVNIYAFMLVFARISAAMMLMPGFAAAYVPMRIRLGGALAVSFAVAPWLAPILPAPPSGAVDLALVFVKEILTGAFLGTLAAVFVSALQTAGTLIALFSGLANALVQDPVSEQQSSTIASFLSVMGVTLVFVTDLHHLMLGAVIDSYMLFDPAQPMIWADTANVLARNVSDSFALGLRLAAPALLIAIVYYVGLGLLSRLMQALPVFFIGMPVQITVQLWILMITVAGVMTVFLGHFQDGYVRFLNP